MEKKLIDILWIIVASGLVFLMQGGFAFVESGMTRTKNSINVAIKNLTDLGVSVVFFWLVGFGIMFGSSLKGVIGTDHFLTPFTGSMWLAAFFLFQSMFCSTSATIVSGAVAERMKFSSYIIATFLCSAIIYPVSGHWTWGGALFGNSVGWLGKIGFIDFAGSTVVHSVGGWIALAILFIIGPRTGRFPQNAKAKKIPGSNIPASVLGVILLWFGWFGFNGGSTLEMSADVPIIIMSTTLAASTSLVTALFAGWLLYKKPEVDYVINGALAGLVAITAPCHVVSGIDAAIIGAVGGLVMLAGTVILEKFKIDDAVGAIPVHLFAGVWGTIAVALFGDPEKIGTGLGFGKQLLVQFTGVAATGIWAFGVAYILLNIINRFAPLRVDEEAERMGLNVAEHGATTEIFELYSVMEKQMHTGNLSLRAPEEPFTEVGQIARGYNGVMKSLEENLIAKTEYINILDNVSDGLLLLDKDCNISPFYSRALETILRKNNLAEMSFISVFKDELPEKTLKEMKDFIGLVFDNSISFSTLQRLNPLNCIEVFIDDKKGGFISKYLDITFQRIIEEGKVTRVMAIVRDLTDEINLKNEMKKIKEKTNTEMEMFYRILHIEPNMFIEFLGAMEENLTKVNSALEDESGTYDEVLDAIYRSVHTIKGDANLFELEFVVERAHQFEEKIELLKKKNNLQSSDFLSLAVMLSEMQETRNQMRTLIDRLMNFQKVFSSHNKGNSELIVLSVKNLLERLSKKTGKQVVLNHSKFDIRFIPSSIKRKIKEIIVQLAQNAVYHGIENPEQRTQLGKDTSGVVNLSTELADGRLLLSISDDGRGIDFNRLKDKALATGLIEDHERDTISKDKLMELLFSSGFSTIDVDEVNVHAGRGVGMDMIKRIAAEIGARMTVKTREGAFSEFHFEIPLPV